MKIELSGRIDSNNAAQVEQEVLAQLEAGEPGEAVVLDVANLTYISSAGLRLVLHVRKKAPELKIINVRSEVYEILEMTGFTQMMPVEKAYREVSIEGCEEIGRGANGAIYRIDQDNVVKVYLNADALEDIQHEREVAKLALILGIPTAISYDVVRVGDSYGSVFELLNARSFSKILAEEPEKMDWCVQEYVEMLKKIHSTVVPSGKLPDMRETVIGWATFMQDYLPKEVGAKLLQLVEAVPHDDHMIHGDYHTKNLQLQNDEVLIIDMDTLAVGNPIFELASMFNSFVGFSEMDHNVIREFQGIDFETGGKFWRKSLAAYLETDDEERIREVEDKARVIGYTRMIRRSIRRKGLETEKGRAEIDHWKEELIDLIGRTETLLFEHKELDAAPENVLVIAAELENMQKVFDFVDSKLEAIDCPPKTAMQIDVVVEEIFTNNAKYAYAPGKGDVTIEVDVSKESEVSITFINTGTPFNPLAIEEPDITLSAEARQVGGLGILMVKKMMDEVAYAYKDGKNIFRVTKAY